MKSITTSIFVKNLNTEKTILESVKNFKGIELLECVSDKYTFIETIGIHKPDIFFMEIENQSDNWADTFDMITKPLFPIAVCEDPNLIIPLLGKGFFDVILEISKENITKCICKILRFYNQISDRLNIIHHVSTPKIDYSNRLLPHHFQNEIVYLKFKGVRVKILIHDILYVHNINEFLVIVLDSGKKYFHKSSLKKFVEHFPKDFIIRINNNIAVNYHKIDRIQNKSVIISEKSFKVSRLYLTPLKEVLKNKQLG
ncbi:MAG TPA: LytTR family transcriptional regulator DNA-binding domain-containing protein [Bacteroidales bacterium]|nr:LytTR family transcriptional regulator DNA-binding domain-containing protein [Bacteroidales bacterium]